MMSAPEIYQAELASGDPLAIIVDTACKLAGAKVLGKPINLRHPQPIGSTIAIGTLKIIALRYGGPTLERALRVLVNAKRGPIKAAEISAAAIVLVGENAGIDDRLCGVVASKTSEMWAAIGATAAAQSMEPIGSAIAAAWRRELSPPADTGKAVSTLPAPSPPAESPPPTGEEVVRRNGVVLNVTTGRIEHRRMVVRLEREEGVALVAALLGVMPALLDGNRLAPKVFGSSDTEGLRPLIADIAPALRRVRLEVKIVPKIGFSLFDLGPG